MDGFSGNDAGTIDDALLFDDLTYAYTSQGHSHSHAQPYSAAHTNNDKDSDGGAAGENTPFASDPYALAVPGVDPSEWPRGLGGVTPHTRSSGSSSSSSSNNSVHRQATAAGEDEAEADLQARLQALTRGIVSEYAVSEPSHIPYHVYGGEDDENEEDDRAEHERGPSGNQSSSSDDDFFTSPRQPLKRQNATEEKPMNNNANPNADGLYGPSSGGGGGIDDGFDDYANDGYGGAALYSHRGDQGGGDGDLYCLDPEGGLGDGFNEASHNNSNNHVDALDTPSHNNNNSNTASSGHRFRGTHDELADGAPLVSSYRPHSALRDQSRSDHPSITITSPTGGRLVMSPSAAEAAESFMSASRLQPRNNLAAAPADHAPEEELEEDDRRHLQVPSSSASASHPSARSNTSQSQPHPRHALAGHHHHHQRVSRKLYHGRSGERLPHVHSAETCEGSCDNHSRETLDSLVRPSSSNADELYYGDEEEDDGDRDEEPYTLDDEDEDEEDEDDVEGTAPASVRTVSTSGGGSVNSYALLPSSSQAQSRYVRQHSAGSTTHAVRGGAGGRSHSGPSRVRHERAHTRIAAHTSLKKHQYHNNALTSSYNAGGGGTDVVRQVSTLSASDTNVPSHGSSYSTVVPFNGSQSSRGPASVLSTHLEMGRADMRVGGVADCGRNDEDEDRDRDEDADGGGGAEDREVANLARRGVGDEAPLARRHPWRHTETASSTVDSGRASQSSGVVSDLTVDEENGGQGEPERPLAQTQSQKQTQRTSESGQPFGATPSATTGSASTVPVKTKVSASRTPDRKQKDSTATAITTTAAATADAKDERSDSAGAFEEDVLGQHNKHVFVLTSAGKPVFTRYGDCNDLSALFGVLQVLMSIAGDSETYSTSVPSHPPQSSSSSASRARQSRMEDTGLEDGGPSMLEHILGRHWRMPNNALPSVHAKSGKHGRHAGSDTLFSRYLQNEADPIGLFDADTDDDDDEEEEEEEVEADDNEEDVDVERLTLRDQRPPFSFHFYRQGELHLVMATRHLDENATYCLWQLRLVHLFILSVLPNVHEMLRDAPGYDVRRHFSVADFDLLRTLLKRCSNEVGFFAGCMEWAVTAASRTVAMDRSLSRRDWFTQLFAHYHQRLVQTSDVNGAPAARVARNQNHLFSFVFYHGRLVAAAGDPASSGGGGGGAGDPTSASHGIAPEDLFLLEHFAQHVVRRQRGGGANWAPICLPCFNRSGYVWAYICDLSTRVRETWWSLVMPPITAEDDNANSNTDAPAGRNAQAVLVNTASSLTLPFLASADSKAPGLLYVQVSASPSDSSYCDENTTDLCHDLLLTTTSAPRRSSSSSSSAPNVPSPAQLGSVYFRFEEDVAGRPIRGGHQRLVDRYREEQPARHRRRSGDDETYVEGREGEDDDGDEEGLAASDEDDVRGVVLAHSDQDDDDEDGGDDNPTASSSFVRSSLSSSSFFRPSGMSTSTAASQLWSRPSLIRFIVTFGTHMAATVGSAGGGAQSPVGSRRGASTPPISISQHAVAVSALHHLPSLEDQLFCVQWFGVVASSASVAVEKQKQARQRASSAAAQSTGAGRTFAPTMLTGLGVHAMGGDAQAASRPQDAARAGEGMVGIRGLLTSGSGGCESTLLSVGKRERKSLLRRVSTWTNQLRRLSRDPAQFACLVVEEIEFSAVLLIPTVAVMTALCQQIYPSEDVHSVSATGTTTTTAPPAAAPVATPTPTPTTTTVPGVFRNILHTSASPSPAFDRAYADRCPYSMAHPPYRFSEFLEASQSAVEQLVVVFLPGTPEVEMMYWSMRVLHGVTLLKDDLFVPLHVTKTK